MNFNIGRKSKQFIKFYCEHCHHWVQGDKKDISAHNNSQKHKRAHQRDLEKKQLEKKRENARLGIKLDDENDQSKKIKSQSEINLNLYKDPKLEKKEEKKRKFLETQQRNEEKYGNKGNNEDDATLAAQGISQKSQRFNRLNGLAKLGRNPVGNNIWSIVVDDETGKLCFMNALSLEKKFEKPMGLSITVEQNELWEKHKDEKFESETMTKSNELATKIGEWQEVDAHDNYFVKNATIKNMKDQKVEYCGYKEQAKGIDWDPSTESDPGDDQSQRSLDDEQIFDQAENLEEAINNLLDAKNDYETAQDADKVKNERLKALADADFDLDFSKTALPYNRFSKKDTNITEILNENFDNTELDLSPTKKLKTEDNSNIVPLDSRNKVGGFSKFKKKTNKKNLTSIGLEDFN